MRIRVPGDKSISQRALILSALGSGTSRLKGLLCSGDTESTLSALRGLGVRIPDIPRDGSEVLIEGVGLGCLLYTSPSPRDTERSRMPSSA